VKPFVTFEGVAVPLLRAHVDTDAIIPSREIKGVGKGGLAEGLFAGWRYVAGEGRRPDPAFVLNEPAYADAAILLAGENFGCGSSREHAVWALLEYGFKAILAPSFSPIFFRNCVRNGLLAGCVAEEALEALAEAVTADPQRRPLRIDLQAGFVSGPDGAIHPLTIDAQSRDMLLSGVDLIALTMEHAPLIAAFRETDRALRPWAYL
jgi:3-isopropylmalate/(R)-2-methylmalate dehydratase small subunit